MHFMFHALDSADHDVEHVKIVPTKFTKLVLRIVSKLRRMLKDPADARHSVLLSYLYGRLFRAAIHHSRCDILFAPAASVEIAYLRPPVPLIYFSDSTFRLIENYYDNFAQMHPLTHWEGDHLERLAINHSDAIIYATDWAARSSVEDYGTSVDKVRVIPLGANMDEIPDRQNLGLGSTDGKCRLLFVGREWKRKGGPIAYETLLALRDRGVDAQLTVVGCSPDTPLIHPALHFIPVLNKNLPGHRSILADLYLNSDIFFLPTRAECSGIVFCEAGAYGLPTVSTDTGGVSTVVIEGVNGLLLPFTAEGSEYAKAIMRLWGDPHAYNKMRQASRDRYEASLNWTAWAAGVHRVIDELLPSSESIPSHGTT
jgi:glycosyltransferase involved in cell wall biosynthesis